MAQAWLVHRWTTPVYRFCRRMLSHDEDARDAAQETLVKVLKNLHRYDQTRSFSTWMFGIARNTCIDEHRRRKRRGHKAPAEKEIACNAPTPLQEVGNKLESERLVECLDDLAPLYREVIVLYHFEHKKYAEIAEILEVPIGTVMNRIFRARKKLKDAYKARGGQR